MRRIRRGAAIAFLVLFVVYAGDYLSARFGIPGNRQTLGTVQVQTMYAVRQKNNRIDYSLGDTVTQTCVRSLFPQMGYAPCWYLARHPWKTISVGRVFPGSLRPLLNCHENARWAGHSAHRRRNWLVAAAQPGRQGHIELVETCRGRS